MKSQILREIRKRVFYAESGSHGHAEPIDFTPHTHVMGKDFDRDHPYFQKMHDFHMGHYGEFLDTLSDPERRMLELDRPVRISTMGNYIRGRLTNVGPGEEAGVKNGIKIMDGIISRSPPLKHDIYLYRGMRQVNPEEIPPGTLMHEPAFPSMSLNGFVSARNFSHNNRAFRVRIPAGTRLAPVTASQINDYGQSRDDPYLHQMEHELLPGRGHTFKITSHLWHDPHTNLSFVNADLLPQGPVTEAHRKPWGMTR